ncbi:FIP1[V]-like protein isoform X1 [Cynara cardunculus var. scolymus]|uniref:FIP1[V]-like protein isoform X1 n=1 Tax=Cynara cardunculus var. scolymus TaxID=59895 RepID=UPI000D62DB8D|nr:FIP1[V]-like protein isoform X1 [Cynara cardunculus var. scolymus]
MEDDDEFGDLYSDVLQPLTISSAPPQPPNRSMDPKNTIPSDDEEILYGATSSNQLNKAQNGSNPNLNTDGNSAMVEECLGEQVAPAVDLRASSSGLVKLEEKGFEEDSNYMDDDTKVKEEALDGNFGIEDTGGEQDLKIPGLSSSEARVSQQRGEVGEGDDDWDDSDSEDDLQILLNDNNGGGLMGMEGGGGADDADNEGEDNLVILGDNDDPNHHHDHQAMEEMQDWGEDASQAAEGGGGRKDLLVGDAAKANGGVGAVIAPKIGYSIHGYHPFHSQFKYVRPGVPGAAPIATGGAPGQVRPPTSVPPFTGRGRGDWRPAGLRNVSPMQKNFHPGQGMPGWGNNGAVRGLEFTLPSHKTIFEVDIDGFEEKPWRLQGIDISDFFNFGLNEESWKEFCKQLDQFRLEATMQSKIRVYESGRTEQQYDPDLPPELAAAAGIHGISSENQNIGKANIHGNLAKGFTRSRMQLPAGRAIQVETGSGERLPSIDTRPPRPRDSDAIIEIILQGSADDESVPVDDIAEQPDDDPSRENPTEGLEIEEDNASVGDHFDRTLQAYNDRKREGVGRRAPSVGSIHDETTAGDRISPFHSEAQVGDHPDSRGKTCAYPRKKLKSPHNHNERRTKRRAQDRSPHSAHDGSFQDKEFADNQKEGSPDNVEGKQSPSRSRLTYGSAEDQDFSQNDAIKDDVVDADGSTAIEREEIALDITATGTSKDENQTRPMKNQTLTSRAARSSVEKFDNREDPRTARSSDNSKARSGSSRDQRSMQNSVEEEVVQARSSVHGGNTRRSFGEGERSIRSRDRDERQESDRHRKAMERMEDPYSRKKWDSNSTYHSKSEKIYRQKGRESEGAWQDEDLHVGWTRAENIRKRDRLEELASRQRHKIRESERSDKDQHYSRKVLENGSWKGDRDRDLVSQHNNGSIKSRHDELGIHNKRRKEEAHTWRGGHTEREEALHVHRDSTSRQKREKDDNLDQRKRDEQARLREDDQHSFRYKEEGLLPRESVEKQRERNEWKEREGREGMRSGRAVEDKAWIGHSRLKEDYRSTEREYQFKDTVREKPGRRDRIENEGLLRHTGREDAYSHGNKLNDDEGISRQERGNTGSGHNSGATDMHRLQDKKPKESVRKSKETDGVAHSSLAPSRRNREDHNSQKSERVSSTGVLEQGNSEQTRLNRQSSRKHRANASPEDERKDSRRGRSKLERWTSHKDVDFSLGVNSSASSHNVEKTSRYDDTQPMKPVDESSKPQEIVEKSNAKPLVEENDDVKVGEEGKHLDTVEKLKKRSERFKLPMPSEKEALAIKKIENEVGTHADSTIKPERPARKRRWTSG